MGKSLSPTHICSQIFVLCKKMLLVVIPSALPQWSNWVYHNHTPSVHCPFADIICCVTYLGHGSSSSNFDTNDVKECHQLYYFRQRSYGFHRRRSFFSLSVRNITETSVHSIVADSDIVLPLVLSEQIHIINWTFITNCLRKLNRNITILTEGKVFQNIFIKIAAILSWPQCVNTPGTHLTNMDWLWSHNG